MAWTGGVTRATGDIVTAAIWNAHMGAAGDLDVLSTHVHTGAAGNGGSSLGPLVLADFTTAAAPAAPGASKGRFYVVTSDRPGFRSGAAGSAEVLVTRDATETLTSKTLTAPTIADFTNAQHDHGDADDGGAVAGLQLVLEKTSDQNTTDSNLVDDNMFSFAIAANEVWAVLLHLRVSAVINGWWSYNFTGPSGCTMRSHGYGLSTNPTIIVFNGATLGTRIDTNWGTGTIEQIHIATTFRNGATAGTIQFKWGPGIATYNVSVYAGSIMTRTKI